MRNIKLLFTLFSVMLLLLAGCNGGVDSESGTQKTEASDKEDGKPKVAVVLKALNSEYFKLMEAGAKKAFEDLGVDGTILAPSNETEVEKQINMLEDLLNRDLDALVVMPSQSDAAIPVLEKYKAKGIPVLLADSDVNWKGKTTFIGTDNYTAGLEAGKALASQLKKGDKIAILEGVLGTPTNEERVKGVEDAAKEAGLEIAASQAADYDRVKAVSAMENILTANPDIKGIFTANDEMALGALRATTSRNMSVPIVGVDGITEAVESVNADGVYATVAQRPYDMTYKGVENALKVLDGEEIEKRIDSGLDVITKENSEEKLSELSELLGK
ncbi:sugar ABC transporter substrate-binding protein [Peribacillus frigoritolerans]|uniref:sugar ABC transporter substrate-binding protein n=1 Tax=Peribacillus frigoritolerans TaxID=450367 RepID=UPI0020BEA0B9|nr:sugar ABC transporter substrate-binding protein [Peribacillus frigoritolerans]MEE3951871.1 sugar ABC transporter substrate-binding protein [Peribacillus frigoritolerans]